jgi:nitroreductase
MSGIDGVFGLSAERTEQLLETAGRAPSLHNTQPWSFRIRPDAIELYADPTRGLPVTDPDGREQRLACGAALFNLRLALHGAGIRPLVTTHPDRDRPELVAVVHRGGLRPPTPEQQAMLRAVPQRHTNRHPFSDVAVATPEQHALRRAALEEGGWLHVVDDPEQLARMRDLAVRAHRTQLADPSFRAELDRWTATTDDRPDGVPAAAGGPLPAPNEAWVLRDFTGGTGRDRVPGRDFAETPLLAVLTAHLTGRDADVAAGQALQRVLLTATTYGLATSFVSQLVEVPSVREELRRLVAGTRPPHAVLRIGYGQPVAATPRRPVADLLSAPISVE